MERNMDESRKAFESWLMEKFGYRQDYLEYWRGEGDYRSHPDLRSRWQGWTAAWQASRAAIEIKLDDKVMVEDEFDKGHNCAIDYCAEAIRAAGIKVKE
ncbi:hypothetical protein ACLEZA_17745 [Enterobacter ludwigii]|uniref:hypothetical protein n=1 Tax=Enterobacter ludwigii TaxID=299767 RepID=UPI003976C435